MARKTEFTQEEISTAQSLRNKAKTTGELRKALSVKLGDVVSEMNLRAYLVF
jgi:hypothetical protein